MQILKCLYLKLTKILCVSPDNKVLCPDRANTYKEAVARYKLVQRIPSSEEVDWGVFSRASLTVRFTVKNGDPPGAGKIWEN